MTIGGRIRELRKKMNFTQEYVAEMLDVSRQAVSKWEKDISKPDMENIILLSELFDTTVEYIAAGKQELCNEKKKINIKRVFIITTASLLLLILFCTVLYIHTRPVNWDAAACGGGYVTWIYDKYCDSLTEVFLNGMGEEKDNIIYIEPVRGTQTAEWNDRMIFLEFEVKYKHKTRGIKKEKLRFTGKRYWIDSFRWNGAIIGI